MPKSPNDELPQTTFRVVVDSLSNVCSAIHPPHNYPYIESVIRKNDKNIEVIIYFFKENNGDRATWDFFKNNILGVS